MQWSIRCTTGLFALLLAFIVITGLTAAAGPVSQMIH